jgi:hypothetical protein
MIAGVTATLIINAEYAAPIIDDSESEVEPVRAPVLRECSTFTNPILPFNFLSPSGFY